MRDRLVLLTTRRPRSATAPRTGFGFGARLCALLCTVLCALLAVVGTAAPASAHAVQTDSSPGEGSVVSSAPRQVTVTFSEEVSMSDGSIQVLGPDGRPVDDGKVRVVEGAGVKRAVGMKSDVPNGTYTVAWKAVSADSHPVAGAFTFSVGAPSKTTARVPESGDDSVGLIDVLYQSGRYTAYAGFVLLVGGAAFVLTCWPRGTSARHLQRLVVTGWMMLTAATLLMLLLRNSYTGSGELSDAFDLAGLKAVLQSKPGAALASRLLLLGTAAVIISVLFGSYGERGDEPDGERGRDLALGLHLGGGVVAVGLAATWAMSEHASTGVQSGLAMPVDVVHLLAVAAWLGGLAAVLTALHRGPSPTHGAVRRFSRIAFGSVLVLTVTGVYQSWRQVGSFTALTGTSYGQLLLVKVALVALLVAVASVSRRWVTRLGQADGASETAGANAAAGTSEAGETPGDAATAPGEPAVRDAEPAAVVTAVETPSAAGSSGTSGTGDGPDTSGTGDARAAQLARQRAAVEKERRRKARDADPRRAGLRRSVLAEAGTAVVLLMVTTGLTNTEPGRTAELTEAGSPAAAGEAADRLGPVKKKIPFDTGGKGGKGTAELWITPGQSGGNSLRIMTKSAGGEPLDASEVLVALTLPSKDLGPISVTFEPINNDRSRWRSQVVQVPLPGEWKAAVTLRTSEIDQVTESRTVRID